MRNRNIEMGRPIKLCNKKTAVAPDLLAWLMQAKKDGEDFAPYLIELCDSDQRRAFFKIRDRYKCAFRHSGGAYRAVLAMFHYALAQIILENPHEDDRELISRGLYSSVIAQNHMLLAFLWLHPDGRKLFVDAWEQLGLDEKEYRQYCQSCIASARFAYATIKNGVKIRIATVENDLHRKIDFFCESTMDGFPTLCVQIKSHRLTEGVQYIILDHPPNPQELMLDEYKMRKAVWRGVTRFNAHHNSDWLAVIARLGVQGVPVSELVDQKILTDTRLFFENLHRRYGISYLRSCSSFDSGDTSSPACI